MKNRVQSKHEYTLHQFISFGQFWLSQVKLPHIIVQNISLKLALREIENVLAASLKLSFFIIIKKKLYQKNINVFYD